LYLYSGEGAGLESAFFRESAVGGNGVPPSTVGRDYSVSWTERRRTGWACSGRRAGVRCPASGPAGPAGSLPAFPFPREARALRQRPPLPPARPADRPPLESLGQ